MLGRMSKTFLAAVLALSMMPLPSFAAADGQGDDTAAKEQSSGASGANAANDQAVIGEAAAIEANQNEAEPSLGGGSLPEEYQAKEPAQASESTQAGELAQAEEPAQPSDPAQASDPAQTEEFSTEDGSMSICAIDSNDAAYSSEGSEETSSPTSVASGDWVYVEDTYYYNEYGWESGGVTITDYVGAATSQLDIPASIDGKPVTVLQWLNSVDEEKVTKVTLPSSLKMLGSSSLSGYTNLSELVIPGDSQLKVLGYHAFEGTGLVEFTMPPQLEIVGESPFYGCEKLKKLTFNDIVEPFLYERSLWSGNNHYLVQEHFNPAPYADEVEYVVPETSKNYKVVNGALMSKDGSILYGHSGNFPDGSFNVPEGTKTIGQMAFFSQENLSHITLPSTLERIEEYAFTYTDIEELIIPDSVTYVGGNIAESCEKLKTVVIGNGVKELGSDAGWECFYMCTSLENLTLGNSLEVIGNACFASTIIKTVNLPATLKQLNYGAFGDCYQLEEVTGGQNLERIYRLAFRNTQKLKTFPIAADSSTYRYVSGTAFYNSAFNPTYPVHMEQTASGNYVVYDATINMTGEVLYSEAYKVLDLVNAERAKVGANPLTMDQDLLKAAVQRAGETSLMWSHSRPNGEDISDTVITDAWGLGCAENIAAGQTNAEDVMNSWMNSEGHKANILDESITTIGIGAFKNNDTIYWVQDFGFGEGVAAAQPSDSQQTVPVKILDDECDESPEFIIVASENSYWQEFKSIDLGTSKQLELYCTNNGSWRTSKLDTNNASWVSSDSNVATVSSDGTITALSVGKVVIAAKIDATTQFYGAMLELEVVDPNANSGNDGDGGNSRGDNTGGGDSGSNTGDNNGGSNSGNAGGNGGNSGNNGGTPTYNGSAVRLAGSDRYNSMQQIVNEGFAEGSTHVAVLATGANFPDALAASSVAGAYNAPVLLTESNSLSEQAKAEIKRLGIDTLYVLGGTASVSDEVLSQVGALAAEIGTNINVTRVSGNDRAATSLEAMKVLQESGKGNFDTVVIASGKSRDGIFGDALSMSPYAYAKNVPILLTDGNGYLTSEEYDAVLANRNIKNIVIAGGDASVGNLDIQLPQRYNIIRLAGESRYETSAQVAIWELEQGMSATKPAIATGQKFPDALAGAALSGVNNSILLLADDTNATEAVNVLSAYANNAEKLYVYGGTNSVSEAVLENCAAAAGIH